MVATVTVNDVLDGHVGLDIECLDRCAQARFGPLRSGKAGPGFRDCVQFCSRLVDLVVCVGRHRDGGHRLALAGERFIRLVAEDIAEAGDHGAELRDCDCGHGIGRETGDGGRLFMSCEPMEKYCEHSQRERHVRGVTRVVVVADNSTRRCAAIAASTAERGEANAATLHRHRCG